MLKDAVDIPAAAYIVPHDRVKHIGAISTRRRTFTHHLLNLIDAVLAAATIEAVSFDRSFLLCRFAPLAPHERPVEVFIYIAELTDGRIKRVAGDGQRLVCFSKQFSRNILPLDLQREFAIERIAVSDTPDADAFAAWGYFLIGIDCSL